MNFEKKKRTGMVSLLSACLLCIAAFPKYKRKVNVISELKYDKCTLVDAYRMAAAMRVTELKAGKYWLSEIKKRHLRSVE